MTDEFKGTLIARNIGIGFGAGLLASLCGAGLLKLWPKPIVFPLAMMGMFVAPVAFCAWYPVKLLLSGGKRKVVPWLLLSLVIGLLCVFAGTVLLAAIVSVAEKYPG